VATAARARRRAIHLGGERPRRTSSPALPELVSSLALPFDAERIVAWLPAALLVVVAVAVAVAGAGGVVAVLVGAAATTGVLRRSAPVRRAARAERDLPVVLDGVARQLRAGSSLAQAIASARPPAAATELRPAWDRLADLIPVVGVTAAIDDWAEAAGPPSLRRSIRLSAAALALAASTGGSPARAIDGVAATLRARLAVADEVRALSSQARLSAAVIAAAPAVFGALAGLSDPRTREFLSSGAGAVVVTVGLGLDGLGAWWMARLCRPPERP
jgi:tight adherence protein B